VLPELGGHVLELVDASRHGGVALAFSTDIFPHAWLRHVYGGWRGHHHLRLEPWTGHPMQLDAALAAGRARVLPPGGSLEADVAFVVYAGLDSVSAVEERAGGFAVR
jgi:hypothetical protein